MPHLHLLELYLKIFPLQTFPTRTDKTNPYAILILKAQKGTANPSQTLKMFGGFPDCPLKVLPSEMVVVDSETLK